MNTKQIIVESYYDVIELDKLSRQILDFFAKLNANNFYSLYKNPDLFNNIKNNKFIENEERFLYEMVNVNDFDNLKDFITDSDLKIVLTNKDWGNKDGQYFPKEEMIKILTISDNFYDTLLDYKSDILNIRNRNDIYKITKNIFYDSFKSLLVHELQHAYDDYRTSGNFYKTKETFDFLSGDRDVSKFKELVKYLNIPHEIWARFSETVSDFNDEDWKEDFNSIVKGFKKNFYNYNYVPEKYKKKLLKALYKLYDLKK